MHLEVKGLMISLQRIRPLNMAEKWPLDIPQHPLTESNTVAIIASLVARGQIHRKMKLLYCIVAKASFCLAALLQLSAISLSRPSVTSLLVSARRTIYVRIWIIHSFTRSFPGASMGGHSQARKSVCKLRWILIGKDFSVPFLFKISVVDLDCWFKTFLILWPWPLLALPTHLSKDTML